MVDKSTPKTFTPTWVRIPVDNISMRLRIGCVQIFVTPTMRSFASSRCMMSSHVKRRRVSRRFRTSNFADYSGDGRILSNDGILCAHEFCSFCERNTRIGHWHPHRGLFVQRGHEFRSDGGGEVERKSKGSRRKREGQDAM